MPMRRRHTQIPAGQSLVELLVGLTLDEGLAAVPAPDCGRGTSVEEIFMALAVLSDGRWLDGHYQGRGIYESADQWLNDFFAGKEVPMPDDLSGHVSVSPMVSRSCEIET